MTETNADLVGRMARLLKEELQPPGLGFVLIVSIPLDGDRTTVAMTANIEVADALDILRRATAGLKKNVHKVRFLDQREREEGHA